eukprot:CAMPEP_0113933738 /NCGR_PEP_ID=MMETSP1339-20121228/1050_1 /TAXON_ID=94617 /ORGANISM="Fibrocapsa japonica" /LENGTH=695 /DNA_ID=CAMNT_0000935187 /DNA_START=20 /DNA_END=2107 /DNA_ORIENTATION=- /assembly_acc=CAM_ASM_000762
MGDEKVEIEQFYQWSVAVKNAKVASSWVLNTQNSVPITSKDNTQVSSFGPTSCAEYTQEWNSLVLTGGSPSAQLNWVQQTTYPLTTSITLQDLRDNRAAAHSSTIWQEDPSARTWNAFMDMHYTIFVGDIDRYLDLLDFLGVPYLALNGKDEHLRDTFSVFYTIPVEGEVFELLSTSTQVPERFVEDLTLFRPVNRFAGKDLSRSPGWRSIPSTITVEPRMESFDNFLNSFPHHTSWTSTNPEADAQWFEELFQVERVTPPVNENVNGKQSVWLAFPVKSASEVPHYLNLVYNPNAPTDGSISIQKLEGKLQEANQYAFNFENPWMDNNLHLQADPVSFRKTVEAWVSEGKQQFLPRREPGESQDEVRLVATLTAPVSAMVVKISATFPKRGPFPVHQDLWCDLHTCTGLSNLVDPGARPLREPSCGMFLAKREGWSPVADKPKEPTLDINQLLADIRANEMARRAHLLDPEGNPSLSAAAMTPGQLKAAQLTAYISNSDSPSKTTAAAGNLFPSTTAAATGAGSTPRFGGSGGAAAVDKATSVAALAHRAQAAQVNAASEMRQNLKTGNGVPVAFKAASTKIPATQASAAEDAPDGNWVYDHDGTRADQTKRTKMDVNSDQGYNIPMQDAKNHLSADMEALAMRERHYKSPTELEEVAYYVGMFTMFATLVVAMVILHRVLKQTAKRAKYKPLP